MDLFTCIALIVFGILFLIGYVLLVKKCHFPKVNLKNPFEQGKFKGLMLILFNVVMILIGCGTLIAGIVCLCLL